MIKMPPTQVEFIGLEGGLDQVTPPLMMPAGRCQQAQNFEIGVLGGYTSSKGYERFDGRAKPSDAIHHLLLVTFSGTVEVLQHITGVTSGATAQVAAVGADRLVITKLVGNFQAGESLQVSGLTVATVTQEQIRSGGDSSEQQAEYRNLAADVYRADIQAVPGSGQIRGIKWFNEKMYAVRDTADGLNAAIYQSSATGWQLISLGEEVAFTNAATGVVDGATLTQGGVTATIGRVVVETGSLASGVNTGRLILSGRTGGNFAAGAATGGAALTLDGVQTAISLQPGGRFVFTKYDFGAGLRLYGCDGVNRAFEFDGTVFVPIHTGMTADTPKLIAAHKNHLFLAFGHSLQHSAIANPYAWTPLLGAAELNLGDQITNLMPMPSDNIAGGSLACLTRNRSYMLYGSSSSDWNLVSLRHDAGAMAHTTQFINTAYLLDDLGVTTMDATNAFGNFLASSISQLIRPWINANKANALDSCVVREKNQYRLLFTNRRVLTMTLVNNAPAGYMPLELKHDMVLMEQDFDASSQEVLFYGDTSGYVYQAERGTSYDGEVIDCYLNLAFNHSKSPRTIKQYRKVVFEVGGVGFTKFLYSADLAYADADTPQIPYTLMDFGGNVFGDKQWDVGTWDVGCWDGRNLLPSEQSITGVAQNMAMKVNISSDYYEPITIYGALLHFTPRRQMR